MTSKLLAACQTGDTAAVEANIHQLQYLDFQYRLAPLISAIACGNQSVLDFLITRVAVGQFGQYQSIYNWNDALDAACRSSDLRFVTYAISKGATASQAVICGAARKGLTDIVRLLLSKFNVNRFYALSAACESGQLETIALLAVDATAYDCDGGMFNACFRGVPAVVDFLIRKGATNWNSGLIGAIEGNHLAIAQRMIANGVTNIDDGFKKAVRYGNPQMVAMLLLNGGVTTVRQVLNGQNDADFLRLLLETTAVTRSMLVSVKNIRNGVFARIDRFNRTVRRELSAVGWPVVLLPMVVGYCCN